MQSTTSKESKPARITALWFGVQLIWGAVLGISLQARYLQLTSGSSLELFGWISASGAGAAAITQLVVGPISDAMRRRGRGRGAFYAAGALLGAVAILAFYASSSLYGLLGSFVALQIALNIIIGPYQAIIPDLIPPQRFGVASAWLAAMGSAGNACGAILATLLGGTLRLGLALAAGLLASASITILYSRRLPMQPLSPAASFTANRTLVDLFVSRAFVYLGFYTILLYLYFFVASILPHGFALDATRTTGLCVLLFTVVGALGALLAARPADRSDERLVVSVGGCLVALSLAALAQIHAMGGACAGDRPCGGRVGHFSLRGLGLCLPSASAGRARNEDGYLEPRRCRSADARAPGGDRNTFAVGCSAKRDGPARRAASRGGRNAHRNALDLAFTWGPKGA